ncbi:hypothetical protein AB6A40_001426 [Gnathostoma spinigerum]|uniref:Transmembrane protein 39A n=1 Tax=Gnathostoma spinigerum TaxID=75299 RepID=A0ABD6EDF0_9BILA
MVGRSTVRSRHHGNRPSTSGVSNSHISPKSDEKGRSGDTSGLTVPIHPIWPEMPQGQGELFFECTLFLYSVLALFLQYLNLYKTLWWLPKSYWHYSMKFHLINPYLLSCVGLLLGARVTRCFWNTITDLAAAASQGTSGVQLMMWRIIEWAIVKTPMITMVLTSFIFSFSRVYSDFPLKSMLYFGHPFVFFVFLFHNEVVYKTRRVMSILHFIVKGGDLSEINNSPMLYSGEAPPSLVDIDSVVHMCSSNPVQIREEVSILMKDFSLRLKHCFFSGVSTAYLSVFVPCVFTPQTSYTGIPQYMHIDVSWVIELFLIVLFTSFSLYMAYLLPINYCDLLHRSSVHLGEWRKCDIRQPAAPSHTGANIPVTNSPPNPIWSEADDLYPDGSIVRYGGQTYRAIATPGTQGVAAEPGNADHIRFRRIGADSVTVVNAMCVFQILMIAAQFWMLILTTDWQHIVTLVLLMFANYLLLAKVFKDRVVIGRIYNPSPEDILLIRQMQQGG